MTTLTDRTVLVTGATDGLGRALARAVAEAGATVLLHGRDPGRGEQALAEVRDANPTGDHDLYLADLASLRATRELADRVADDHDRLHVLVNNAGVGFHPGGDTRRQESADGHELHLAVNYLAPVLLTRRLAPLLARSAPARVVQVASAGQAPVDLDDLEFTHGYDGVDAYRRSKLALVMATIDQAAELADDGVTVNALHPATYMDTTMVTEAGITPHSSVQEGLDATMRLVADDAFATTTGTYSQGTRRAEPDPQARDDDARARLREMTDQMLAPFLTPGG